jgi:hypothetical protein
MKILYNSLFLASIFCFCAIHLQGQTFILLDERLKSSSQPMPAKRKGISAVGKYEFGPYKIISGKEGWTKTREKSEFFSGDSKIQSSTRKSFVFTGNATDTVKTNITVTSVAQIGEQYGFIFRTLTGWSEEQVIESHETYIAGLETSLDTVMWNLILMYPVAEEISGPIQKEHLEAFQGVITDGQTQIEIIPVFQWDNGSPATLFKPVEGYQFLMNNEALAAVQVMPSNKMHVWIRDDLDKKMKLILAASAAAFLVRSF